MALIEAISYKVIKSPIVTCMQLHRSYVVSEKFKLHKNFAQISMHAINNPLEAT